MSVRHLLVLLVVFFLNSTAQAGTGFRMLQAPDPGSKDITFGLWYPTDVAVPDEPNTRFGHALALDAPINATKHPLVLLSHGYSGWYGGHADLALALANAGYLVAAPSHTGNHFADMTSPVDKWALDRPRHISATLDYLLQHDLTRDAIDGERIGVYGFSAGGFTVLSLIGAVPDFDHARERCRQVPSEFVCAEGMIDVMLNAKIDSLPASAWGHDPRIRAAAIAAPGLAFAYSDESLANVSVPVQLWSAMNDHSVPHESNALPLSKRLPSPVDTHWVDNASHFAFIIIPCRPAFEKADPEEYKMVCGDADGFDRREFLQSMAEDMIRFFDETL